MVPTRTSPFQQYVDNVRPEVNTALTAAVRLGPECPARLQAAIEHSLLAPGKRLRPFLVLMSAEACGSNRQVAMPAACAVELIHAYSLIHDDLPAMDDDNTRRGRPSCHVAFGEATAILAGDALLALAFEILAAQLEPPEVAAGCCRALARAAGATALVGGQMDDLNASLTAENGSVTEKLEQLHAIHARKTAALLRTCLQLGAMAAQAGNEQMTLLDTYGKKIGLAFQIVDDLLDARGNASEVGKAVRKDADHDKLTFPGVLGIDESERCAKQLVDEACQALIPLGQRGEHLEALARYILERNH